MPDEEEHSDGSAAVVFRPQNAPVGNVRVKRLRGGDQFMLRIRDALIGREVPDRRKADRADTLHSLRMHDALDRPRIARRRDLSFPCCQGVRQFLRKTVNAVYRLFRHRRPVSGQSRL